MASGNNARHTRLSQSVSGESGMVVRHSSVQRCEASSASVATTSPAAVGTEALLGTVRKSACALENARRDRPGLLVTSLNRAYSPVFRRANLGLAGSFIQTPGRRNQTSVADGMKRL